MTLYWESFGATRIDDREEFILWAIGSDSPALGVTTPFNGNPATVGNGVMVGLETICRDQVHAIYEKAMELGATDEGTPGPRGDQEFYGAYFRDRDGNKLAIYCMEKPR